MEQDKLEGQCRNLEDCLIEGVDTISGLRGVGGRPEVYQNVLGSFCRESRELLDSLDMYREENPRVFYMKVHGLRSSCMYIGAFSVAEEAKGLEKAFNEGNDVYISTNLFYFKKNMENLLHSIGNYLTKIKGGASEEEDDTREKSSISGVPRNLAAVFRESVLNMESAEINRCMAVIREKRYDRNVEIYLGRIERCLDNLDYEEALDLLGKITEQI